MGLGKSRIAVSIGLLFLFVGPLTGQDGKNIRYHRDSDEGISHSTGDDGSIMLTYNIPEINIRNISNETGRYYRLSLPGHVSSPDPGKPELPVFSRLISIPEGASYKISITGVETKTLRPARKRVKGILYPAQESRIKAEQALKPAFRIDRNIYAKRGVIPSDTVTIVPLGKARSVNLSSLNISPVRYNPKANSLEIITSMKVLITFLGPEVTVSSLSPAFKGSLSKGILNLSKDLIPGFAENPVGMVILTDTAFKKQIADYVKWKTQKGFRVKVLYKGISGKNYTELRDTLALIYRSANVENPPPDYLLIIGDISRVPYYGMGTSGNVTDMYYGEFDGNGDYLPEMYIGRIPAKDTSEVRTALSKIIQYEKFEFDATNHFHSHALATTGLDPEHAVYMNGQIRYPVTNYFTGENNISEAHFYHQQMNLTQQKDSIIRLINRGTSFINYSGHGDNSGWLHLNIKTVDTSLLNNRNMYPVIISNACKTSQFHLANSFGSRMVLEKNRGASAFIGCSNDSYWDEDYYWAVGVGNITENPVYEDKGPGIFDRLFHTKNEPPSEWYFSLGQINYAGNLSVTTSPTVWKKYYWETYNIVGDPSMIPVIGTPKHFNFSLPDTLPRGIRSVSMILEPFAYIAVSDFDNLWDASYASKSGAVTLDIPVTGNDSCLIVVTGQNRYPVLKTVRFANITKEYLNLDSTLINDILGNNNQRADFGEVIELSAAISNRGATDAYDVRALISSASQHIDIGNDSIFVGTLAAGSGINIPAGLQIIVRDNVPDMAIAPVELRLKSGNSEKKYMKDLIIHAPDLKIMSFVVDDTESGNGDRIADPGESFNIVFKVLNEGSSDASGQFTLVSNDQQITILEPNVKSGMLKYGEITDIPVLVKLSELVPSGSNIAVSSSLHCNPYLINKNFTLRIGKVRETFEAGTFSIFPWINNSAVPWTISGTSSFEGNFSARSGVIGHNSSSALVIKTFYPVDDTLKFQYRVSSEPTYDVLSFRVNGKEIFKKSGETGWALAKVPLKAGLNTMEWTYKKDQSVSQGNDCAWIDLIDFATGGTLNYIQKDLFVARISAPGKKERYGKELLSVKLLNTGRDTIKGFSLAWAVNGLWPVKEDFSNILLPGADTSEVTFSSRVDLSRYGVYDIKVFGTGNNDDYIYNDTSAVTIENVTITEKLTVYPNPFSTWFSIFIRSDFSETVGISISDSGGKIVYTARREVTAGYNTLNFTNVRLNTGIYYMSITGTGYFNTVKLMNLRE
jgi:hypothetical protein